MRHMSKKKAQWMKEIRSKLQMKCNACCPCTSADSISGKVWGCWTELETL